MSKAKHTPGPLAAGTIEYGTILQGPFVLYRLKPCASYEDLNEADKERLYADATLYAAAPEMLQALQYANELIAVARQYFPKSIRHSDKFQLENTCATIGKAIAKAEGKL